MEKPMQLNRFNWTLVKRVFAMTAPYWVSSGPQQKWLLLGFLSLMGTGASVLWLLYSFLLQGGALAELLPASARHVDIIALTAAYLFGFKLPQIQGHVRTYAVLGGGLLVGLLTSFFGFYPVGSPVGAILAPCFGYLEALGASNSILFGILGLIFALGLPVGYLFAVRKIMHRGWSLLGILISLLFSVSGLNVLLSYLNRDMMNALQGKEIPEFWTALTILGSVFIVGIPIVVCYRWVRDKLGLAWRDWLTQNLMERYMSDRSYYRISQMQSIDNPDQRISEDIRYFTQGALSFVLIILDSVIALAAFSLVLWAISPLLSGTVIVYSLVGSLLTVWIGKRLISINFHQEEYEANFRYNAVHVRNNAEAIAFYQGEEMEKRGLSARLADVIRNYNYLIGWQRNLGFLTQGYQYLVIVLPTLVMAQMYFDGEVQFGQIMQATMAFNQILSAMSLLVTEFTSIARFAANVNRIATFMEEVDSPDPASEEGRPRIERSTGGEIVLKDVTLMTPNYALTLVEKLDLEISNGSSVLIMGPSGSGKSSLLRGISGLWRSGHGHISTPEIDEMLFMPQRPYLPLGSLRWAIVYPNANSKVSDAEIQKVLETVNLPKLVEKLKGEGGLDAVRPWGDVLSLGEQQRVAFARLLLANPNYAILDEASSALDSANEELLYEMLRKSGTTFISVGHRESLRQYHDKVLTLDGKGGWSIQSLKD